MMFTIVGILLLTILSPLFGRESYQIGDTGEENLFIVKLIITLLILFSQFLFLINLGVGIFRKNKVFKE